MKKYIKFIISILLLCFIGYLGYNINHKLNYKKQVAERIERLPDFSLKSLDGLLFSQNDVNTDLPKLFIYFNSECEFCQAEAQQIHKNIEQLIGVQILFVSFEEVEKIKSFAEQYALLNHNNVIFLEDEKLQFEKIFDAKSIPFMLLYSKENQLIQKFKGATKIENIIKYLD